MTKITREQHNLIIKEINTQFEKLKPGNSPSQVLLFSSKDFTVQTTKDDHILTLNNYSKLKNIEGPTWLTITSGTDTIISVPHARTAEIVFLLCKSYEDFFKDSSQPYFHSVSSQLKVQVKVWKGEGEPIGPEAQRGLLGEILTLVEIAKIKGQEAIDSWDDTSRAAVDFTHNRWSVEAKSKSSGSSNAKISSKEQLTHKGIPLILSVVDVNRDKKNGKTLPQIIDMKFNELRTIKISEDLIANLKDKIDATYRVFKYETNWFSKWKTGGICFYDISEGSDPAAFSKGLPATIDLPSGYSLNLTGLKKGKLSDLLPKS